MPRKLSRQGDKLPIAIQTLYADLVEKAWTGSRAVLTERGGSAYSQAGNDGRSYLYWQPTMVGGKRPTAEYIGVDNAANRDRLRAMQDAAAALKERSDMVRALRAARLPATDKMTGEVLAAVAEAGIFRMRAAVIGSVAFQAYSGLLGVRLPLSLSRNDTLDITQVSLVAVECVISDTLLNLLQRVDKGFTAIPNPMGGRQILRYALRRGSEEVFAMDVLCPLSGHGRDRVSYLRALRSNAQTIRYLGCLLYQAPNAVALTGTGIPINVPAPERYALHKVMVSQIRPSNPLSQTQASKDIAQASALIQVLAERRQDDLRDAWVELLSQGPTWRQRAARGWNSLERTSRTILADMTPDEFRAELLADRSLPRV